jgi:hypothetical protein
MQTTQLIKQSPSHVYKCEECCYLHGGKTCGYCKRKASGYRPARPGDRKQDNLLRLWKIQCTKAADARARAAFREFKKMHTFICQDARAIILWHLANGIADTMIYED